MGMRVILDLRGRQDLQVNLGIEDPRERRDL